MKIVELSNYANVRDSVKDFIPVISNGDKVSFDFLDVGTQEAIVYGIRDLTKLTTGESTKIAKKLDYIVEPSDDDFFEMRVVYEFSYDEKAREAFVVSLEIREILEEYGATIEAMDFIVKQVAMHNKKLKMLLKSTAKDGVESWMNLNSKIVEETLKIYNKASINLLTKEIVSL